MNWKKLKSLLDEKPGKDFVLVLVLLLLLHFIVSMM
jgi:hypothetical protein